MDANTALLENYDDVQRLACSFAWKFGYDPEDMTQEACVHFLRYWDQRPTDMPASNFIRCYVNYRLIDVTSKGQKKKAFSNSETPNLTEQSSVSIGESLTNLIGSIGEDAKMLLSVFLDTPAEVRDLLRTKSAKTQPKTVVSKYMQKRYGWKSEQVHRTLLELESAASCMN